MTYSCNSSALAAAGAGEGQNPPGAGDQRGCREGRGSWGHWGSLGRAARNGPCDRGQDQGSGGRTGDALPGTELYSRPQGLHEDEGFADVAGLLLPGASAILLLAPHLLQSGSRVCCEEQEQRSLVCSVSAALPSPIRIRAGRGLGGAKCSTNLLALVMRSALRAGGTLEGERGTWSQGKGDLKVTLAAGEHPWTWGAPLDVGNIPLPEQEGSQRHS